MTGCVVVAVRVALVGCRDTTSSGWPIHRRARPAHGVHDARRPPAIAVLVAIALYAVLPEPLIGPRFLIPAWNWRCWSR